MPFRPTVRLRLTLLYGGLFLLAGAVLLAVNYVLVKRGLATHVEPAPVPLGVEVTFVPEAPPAQELVGPDGRPLSDVLEEFQVRLRDRALHELLVQSGLALGIMAVVSVGLGWAVAGRVLQPLQRMTAAARRLSEANLHERLDLQGPQDELKELADTFDAMLARLEAAFESQRRFVANASHELRTPLAIQRALIDVALADPSASPEELRAMAAAVRDAVDRSEQLIEGLLVLARSQQGMPRTEPVDLAAVAARAVDQARAEADAAGLGVDLDLRKALVSGNEVLLERLVANLVQNGVRHNHPGGWLAVETGTTGGEATVSVRNSGAVVPADRVDELFEPFRRLSGDRVDSARGVGLGLSIVRSVTAAHNGSVRAEPIPEGGLAVLVTLPGLVGGGSSGEEPAAPRPGWAGQRVVG